MQYEALYEKLRHDYQEAINIIKLYFKGIIKIAVALGSEYVTQMQVILFTTINDKKDKIWF